MIVREFLQLPGRRLDEAFLAKAERGTPQAREPLDIFLAGLVVDVDAFALGDDEWALALMLLEIGIGMELVGDVTARRRNYALHRGVPARCGPLLSVHAMPQVQRTPPTRDATAARAAPRQPVAAF